MHTETTYAHVAQLVGVVDTKPCGRDGCEQTSNKSVYGGKARRGQPQMSKGNYAELKNHAWSGDGDRNFTNQYEL